MTPFHLFLGLLVMAIWGCNFVVAKFGIAQIPPMTFMAIRFAIVALVLLPFVQRPKGKMKQVFAFSISLGGIHFGLMFTALQTVDAATASLLTQLNTPLAVIMAAIFLKDYPGWRRTTGILVAFVGAVIIAGEPRFEGGIWPILMIIGAGVAWAVGAIQVKAMGEVDGFALNAWVALFSIPQLLIWSFIFESGQWEAVQTAGWDAWASVFYQSFLVVILGYGIWYWLLKLYPVSQTMPLTLLVPFVGVSAGVLFLDEALTLQMLIGGALTIAGVSIIVLRQTRLEAKESIEPNEAEDAQRSG